MFRFKLHESTPEPTFQTPATCYSSLHFHKYNLKKDPFCSVFAYSIWRAVAEDFAPFDVDVTTEYPGSEDLIGKTDGTGPGIRVAIGGSSYDWFGAGAGGVAYVGGFANSYYSPAYVFPAQLGNGVAKNVAEAVSHEGKECGFLCFCLSWSVFAGN